MSESIVSPCGLKSACYKRLSGGIDKASGSSTARAEKPALRAQTPFPRYEGRTCSGATSTKLVSTLERKLALRSTYFGRPLGHGDGGAVDLRGVAFAEPLAVLERLVHLVELELVRDDVLVRVLVLRPD